MSMSDWEQLQHILNCPVRVEELLLSDHPAMAGLEAGTVVEDQSESLAIITAVDDGTIQMLNVGRGNLNETEKALIAWSVARYALKQAEEIHDADGGSEAERSARAIGEWIVKQSLAGGSEPLPSSLSQDGRLYAEMIPFLLETEQTAEASAFGELQKLLDSFLDEDVIVIPLKGQEWLVLAPLALVRDTLEDRDEQAETLEESLASIGSGLQEMLASEWIGECHLAVGRPMKPVKSVVQSVTLLRETIELGRIFELGANIHLPWNMHLERLLANIPEVVRYRYVEQALGRADVFMETETLSTLDTFFALDCNVSETAKKLFIHRNTLLYRLDKLKQETGLDVRVFRDAVLMKIILLLYKFTKRA
ncbi:PucR family transcriptional regulator [Paenibacillus kobensis]|uniref:PucR family transcriptional regulator n=1 Tax=Paenibacillus kobensis TaxID=59841 RepID=UPI001FED0D3E|nr:PucR family transcriptional regulator [Paenibacillus kobensis]